MRQFILLIFVLSALQSNSQTWQSLGPAGGYFKDFTFHPSNSQIVFAGSDDSGGIWKSTNGGQTWSLTTSSLPNFTGWKVVIDQLHPTIVYGCDLYSRYGLIKSNDGGTTWTVITNGLPSKYDRMVTGLTIAHNKPDTLMICTGYDASGTPPRPGNGVFKSFNGGINWSAAGLQGTTVRCIANNGAGGAIFAGTVGSGLKITTNFGSSWINHPQIPSTSEINEIETASNVVMVSAGGDGVYLSTDYGNNFTNIGMIAESNFDINILKISPSIELFSSTFSGLKRWSSATSSWTPVNHAELNNHMGIGIGSSGNNILCSNFNNGLIVSSSDGGVTWNVLINSPKATEIGGLYVDPTNPNHILTSMLGTYNVANLPGKEAIMESNDGGISWTRKGPIAHGRGIAKVNNIAGTFFLGTFAKGLYKTSDAFNTFTNVISGNKVIFDVAVNPNNAQEVLVSVLDLNNTTYSIQKSIDGGITFSTTSSLVCTKLEYDPAINSKVYASTFAGLFESIDGGSTWNNTHFIGIPQSCVKSTTQDIYLARLDGDLVKITGTNTTNITGPWPVNSQITNILHYNGKLIIGINGAEKDTINNLNGSVYLSTNDGTTWNNITGNMPCTHVYGMNALQAIGNDLYAGTYGGGVYKLQNIMMKEPEFKNTNFSIKAYPNPASEALYFNTTLKLEVYDVAGVLRYTGNTDNLNVLEWPNGIYFVKGENISFKFIVSH